MVLVGGPETGKSNYLFRLWLALRDEDRKSITARGLPKEAEYLRAGAEVQLGGAFAPHTPDGSGHVCEIPIYASGREATIVLPDRPGEEWIRFFKDRRWPREWEQLFGGDVSCLVFVRANSPLNQSPLDWISIQSYLGNDANLRMETDQRDALPTQVIVVEWIQMLCRLLEKKTGRMPRIGLIVSAWDTLSKAEQDVGPQAYLDDNFPLLGAFVKSNSNRISIKVFGVSIFDGDFVNEKSFKPRFLASEPLKLGSVVVDNGCGQVQKSQDLTIPIAWALDLEAD